MFLYICADDSAMKSKWWKTLRPILCIVSAVIIYLTFIYWRFRRQDFSTPEISNAVQAALVGILVILTAYYAHETHKQADIAQKGIEGVLWERLIRNVLEPWIKQLEDNEGRFRDLRFDFVVYSNDYRNELKDFLILVRQIEEEYELCFMKRCPNEEKSMKTYKQEIEVFKENLMKFVKRFWNVELTISVKEFLEKRSGGREWKVHEVLEWTIRKLLMTEDQFGRLSLADRFDYEIWEPFVKEALGAFLDSTEEKDSIYAESLRLSDKSTKLRKELRTKQIQLQIEYGV